jgi:hypothetical protein
VLFEESYSKLNIERGNLKMTILAFGVLSSVLPLKRVHCSRTNLIGKLDIFLNCTC